MSLSPFLILIPFSDFSARAEGRRRNEKYMSLSPFLIPKACGMVNLKSPIRSLAYIYNLPLI